ncbi:MAG: hypothetical protein ACI4C3_06720 [Bacteroides sp.]
MKPYILSILLVAASLTANAQQPIQSKDSTLTRTVVVEREYTPEILDAQKVNVVPQVMPPSANHPSVKYDQQLHPACSVPASVMPPYVAPQPLSNGWPGYLHLGLGNLSQWDAQAAYRFAPSERDALSLNFYARGDKTNFKLSGEDTPWNSGHLNGGFNALYTHRSEHSEFSARSDLGMSKFDLLPSSDLDKQQFTTGNLTFGLRSTTDAQQLLHYDARTSFTYHGRKELVLSSEKDLSEMTLGLDGHVWTQLKESQWIDLGITLNQYLYNGDDALKNQTTLTLCPSFRYETESWKIRLGLKSDLAFGFGKQWQAAPDVEAVYTTGSHVLYARATGGRLANDFDRIGQLAPYAQLPFEQADATYEQLNVSAGWKGSPLPGFWIHLYGGYQQLRNDLIAIRDNIDGGTGYPWYQSTEFTKNHNLYGGTALRYSYRELFGLRLSALYRNWTLDEWEQVAFKPELELEGALDFRPLKGLQFTTGYRHTTLSADTYEALSDLYLQGSYTLSQVWSGLGVFFEAHNLLDKEYEFTPCVPALGLRLIGGVSLRF